MAKSIGGGPVTAVGMASVGAGPHEVPLHVKRQTSALIVGFTALAQSQFVPTIYFGVLVSLAMLGGLLGNLVMLPLLLALITKEPEAQA